MLGRDGSVVWSLALLSVVFVIGWPWRLLHIVSLISGWLGNRYGRLGPGMEFGQGILYSLIKLSWVLRVMDEGWVLGTAL
jgi:hypothetical protein